MGDAGMHPTPWRVDEKYDFRLPRIIDADGTIVVVCPDSATAHKIVYAVNAAGAPHD